MSKIALIYSFNTRNSAMIAEKIKAEMGNDKVKVVNAEDLDENIFLSFDSYILSAPTWFDGELPNYWDEFVPALEDMDLSSRKVAIFGAGDQKEYPENFVDAIGVLGKLLESKGATLVGETSADGYTFESSAAVRNGKFMGLALDVENQSELIDDKIKKWVKSIKSKL